MDPISMNSYNVSSLLRIGGLATGLDTDSIVKQLMKVASLPLDKLNQQKQWYQWQQEDLRDINAKLMNLRNNVVASLRLQSTFMAKTVTSSNPSVATATAGANAVNGTYILNVQNLAKAAYRTGNGFNTDPNTALGKAGTIKINNVSISITPDDSLNTIISKINNSTAGVTVTYDASLGRVFFISKTTGQSAKIDFTGSDAGGYDVLTNNFKITGLTLDSTTNTVTDGSIASGEDAEFTINNDPTKIYKSTNSFTLLGLNITLTGTGTTNLTVSTDVDKIYNTIKNFVDTYNDVITQMHTKLTEKRYYDYPPLTDEQKQAMKENDIKLWEEKARSGDLANDETLMRAYYSLRQAISSTVSGAGSLSSIGITTGQWYEGGKLYIDEAKLKDAIANNLNSVIQIFTGVYSSDGTTLVSKGIAQQLYGYFENGTFKEGVLGTAINAITRKAGSSTQLYDNSFIGNRIREIDDRIAEMQKRLKDLEDRYYRQFSQLEIFVGQMNTQSAWLNQQIGIMTK
ncbi:flagellar filament capping protein FliD [Caldanaerobacter sp.]|uniref:flagellar filament capping protein FliD n=1 Tax=Caldanaerobacter sp. TaxID=2930036 RepID=UPI003C755644